jgi:hypothetical protein
MLTSSSMTKEKGADNLSVSFPLVIEELVSIFSFGH